MLPLQVGGSNSGGMQGAGDPARVASSDGSQGAGGPVLVDDDSVQKHVEPVQEDLGEKVQAKPRTRPVAPSANNVAEHEVSHYPYREWWILCGLSWEA